MSDVPTTGAAGTGVPETGTLRHARVTRPAVPASPAAMAGRGRAAASGDTGQVAGLVRPARLRRALLAGTVALGMAVGASGARAACGTLVLPTGLGANAATSAGSLHPILSPGSALRPGVVQPPVPARCCGSRPDHSIDWSLSHASAIDVQEGGRVFVVTLKPITWSDGAPVTADDVLYSFELMKQLGHDLRGLRHRRRSEAVPERGGDAGR